MEVASEVIVNDNSRRQISSDISLIKDAIFCIRSFGKRVENFHNVFVTDKDY